MHFSVRVAYPENSDYKWGEAVKAYKNLGVEVAFYKPDLFLKNVVLDEAIKPIMEDKIKVSSVHFAQFNLVKKELFSEIFFKTMEILRGLNCKLLVIHPSFGRLKEVQDFIERVINPVIQKEGIYLCWETFESKKKTFGGIKGLFDYCRNAEYHRVCYDFSHINKTQEETLEEIDRNFDLIKIFHMSNKLKGTIKQHYPVFYDEQETVYDFDDILSFLEKRRFNGHLVLEYLPEFHSQLLPDALRLMERDVK